MNIAQGWEITEAQGTDQEIGELANQAIDRATKMNWRGVTFWVHKADDNRDLVPMVTVKRID